MWLCFWNRVTSFRSRATSWVTSLNYTHSSDIIIIIMGPYTSTNTIHQHHKVSQRGIMVWKFITCKSLWSFGPFSAQLALRCVVLVRDREVCARPPRSMSPKSILGTLGVTMGPYQNHAMSSDHVDSVESILSFSSFPTLNVTITTKLTGLGWCITWQTALVSTLAGFRPVTISSNSKHSFSSAKDKQMNQAC